MNRPDMQLAADENRCISSGLCAMFNPALFGQDPETGRVQIRAGAFPPAAAAQAREAVRRCPAQALRFTRIHSDTDHPP